MYRLRTEVSNPDAVDVQILQALIADARVSVAQLAREVGLSAPSVAERIRRLEDSGMIAGYTLKIDAAALGLPVAAWLRVRPVPGHLQTVAGILRNLPEVVECDRITGEDCFLARAHVRSVAALEDVIDQLMPYATTNTSIIQSSPVPPRLPRIPAGTA